MAAKEHGLEYWPAEIGLAMYPTVVQYSKNVVRVRQLNGAVQRPTIWLRAA